MNWAEFFRVSLDAMAANKMRSLLTMLGIIIGVAAVIVMISLGQGAKKAVADRLSALGTDLIYVRSGFSRPGGIRVALGTEQRLDVHDLRKLRQESVTLDHVVPEITGPRQIVYGNRNWNSTVIGTDPEYFELRNFVFAEGQAFDERDVNSLARVAVIGPKVAENLFGNINPVGKSIRVGRSHFEIVGLTRSKGVSGGWLDFDDVVVIPYTTAQKRVFGIDHIERLVGHLRPGVSISDAYLDIEKIIRRSHRLRPEQENDFFLQSQTDFMAAREETTKTLTYLLAGVALVSLIVGGIGIMNIMLVSVTERTREIGIRIAIGAKRKDIMGQFMLESLSIAMIGGIIGIMLGIGGSFGMTEIFGWKTYIVPEAIALSFFFAFAVGMFFGIYPARKAARLNPIEALRYE